ncbi:MAG: helix-turn-helix domain-containing protein [Betaproteobacteria bacterium]|nr:helix-turn-helix domain-containing protein [Betaproteobacteria bacterium]
MVVTTSQWATEDVVNWLIEAARTAHRLPPVRVQGHFNVWPTIVRTHYERMVSEDVPVYRFPPSPAEIERMLDVMRWMQCLELEQRQLVWMRAERWTPVGSRNSDDDGATVAQGLIDVSDTLLSLRTGAERLGN